jgi:hypothetical protein
VRGDVKPVVVAPPASRRAVDPRILGAAAAVVVLVAAAFWLVALGLNRSKTPAATPAAAPTTEAAGRAAPGPSAVRSAPAPAPLTTTAPAPAPREAAPEATPEATVPAPLDAAPAAAEPAAEPPAATTGSAPPKPSAPAAAPSETIVANFRTHVQSLIAKKDAEQAFSVLTEALAYAPADKALNAMTARVLEQAKLRAAEERTKAVVRGASARPAFKQADRATQRARTLTLERKTAASTRAYLDAAELFAGAAERTVAGGATGADDPPVVEAAAADPAPAAAVPAAKSEPAPARAPSAPVDPVIEAFVSALSRGDRAAMLAVFPTAPPELLPSFAKRSAGYTLRTTFLRPVRDSRGYPEVLVTVDLVAPSGATDGKPLTLVVALEPAGDNWKVVSSRWRP